MTHIYSKIGKELLLLLDMLRGMLLDMLLDMLRFNHFTWPGVNQLSFVETSAGGKKESIVLGDWICQVDIQPLRQQAKFDKLKQSQSNYRKENTD